MRRTVQPLCIDCQNKKRSAHLRKPAKQNGRIENVSACMNATECDGHRKNKTLLCRCEFAHGEVASTYLGQMRRCHGKLKGPVKISHMTAGDVDEVLH